jgi:hypothetical protein
MALVPCRECGKEVSDQADSCPNCGIKTPSKKRRQIKLATTAVTSLIIIMLLIGGSLWAYHRVVRAFEPPLPVGADGKPIPIAVPVVPKIQKDIPVKQQIIQKDYKEKIREMLDSGQSIRDISKKTGMRKDEIRKIKKDKDAAEK